MERWSAFPTWWVRQGLLKRLDAAAVSTGTHIAALKVYLSITIASDYATRTAHVSLTQLQEVSGLSRPMIAPAIRLLEQLGILSVDRSGYRNVYTLIQADGQTHWMKIPKTVVRAQLRGLPNSTVSGLAALKLFLVLLTVRQRRRHEAPISHKKLQAYTGVRPSMIARGISHLIAQGMVRFSNKPIFTDSAGHPVNTYYVLGVFSEGNDTPDDAAAGVTTPGDYEMDDESPELAVA